MSGPSDHSTAEIIRALLVDLGLGSMPTAQSTWPISYSQEPDKPDNAITVYDTTGREDGRTMVDGRKFFHHGIQIRTRSQKVKLGHTKTRDIAIALDEQVQNTKVTVDSSVYLVHAISRTTEIISLGKEAGVSKRNLFTLNVIVSLRQLA